VRRFKELESEEAFTIPELLVVILAGSLIIGFCCTLYALVERHMSSELHARDHRHSLERTLQKMTYDAQRSGRMVVSDSTIEFSASQVSNILYRVCRKGIERNGILMNPDEGARWTFAFTCAAGDTSLVKRSVLLKLSGSWKHDSASATALLATPWSSASEFESAAASVANGKKAN
jgi:hypothetical protein